MVSVLALRGGFRVLDVAALSSEGLFFDPDGSIR
jgi:hypothetical protein